MNMTLKEAYEILNIDSHATIEEARNAYHTIAKSYDPNLYLDDEVKRINIAFEMISEDIENKINLDEEIRKSQEAVRAKVHAKAREQERREEERKKAVERERVRRIKKIYSDLMQSKEFRKHNISEAYFIENINNTDCSKWGNIHLYASTILVRREKYIKEYGELVDKKNIQIDAMVHFTSLSPNPITQDKKQKYRTMINQKYGTIGDAISTVYKTFVEDINYLMRCFDFNDDKIMSYLIGDREYQEKIFKKAENKLYTYYKIAKFIYSKPECEKEINEEDFLNIKTNKYNEDIIRMKNIENYVNRVFIFKDDGTIGINSTDVTRTEYQKAREWLTVIKNNNLGKIDFSTIIVYINYVAGCIGFIYKKIPHPQFNPNVSPEKLLDIAKVIGTLEKYYILAQEDGITDCYNAYDKVYEFERFNNMKMSRVLELLLGFNKKRKTINRYYLHSYYSLEEIAKMSDDEIDALYERAISFKRELETYEKDRPDNQNLVELYLKKLKDNKKFAPLFNEDVTLTEIMHFLEVKEYELSNLHVKDKPSLINYIFMSDIELMSLKEAPIIMQKKDFIIGHNNSYEDSGARTKLEKMSNKQIDQIYRETVIQFLNSNLPRFKNNPLNLASFGRLDSNTRDSLIAQAEDEAVMKILLKEVSTGKYSIDESDIRAATPKGRIRILKDLKSGKIKKKKDSVN